MLIHSSDDTDNPLFNTLDRRVEFGVAGGVCFHPFPDRPRGNGQQNKPNGDKKKPLQKGQREAHEAESKEADADYDENDTLEFLGHSFTVAGKSSRGLLVDALEAFQLVRAGLDVLIAARAERYFGRIRFFYPFAVSVKGF